MTQSVTFHFSSPQFVFESGIAILFKLLPGPEATLATPDGESFDLSNIGSGSIQLKEFGVRNGETIPVAVASPGLFQAVLTQLHVVRTSDGRKFQIAGVSLQADVTADDLRNGRTTLRIDAPQLLMIRVHDSAGRPVSNATVSVCIDAVEGSSEQVTTENGEIVYLGMPGRYYVAARRPDDTIRAEMHFEITVADSGERVVVLTLAEKSRADDGGHQRRSL